MTTNNTISLEQFKEKHYGKLGAAKREKLESGYHKFKLNIISQKKIIEVGLGGQLNLSITL